MNSKFGRRIRKADYHYSVDIESRIDASAYLFLAVGLLVAVIGMVLTFPIGLLSGLWSALWVFLIFLPLRALAEIVRLLKKIAGLPYSGQITQPTAQEVYACSECGIRLLHTDHCGACGVTMVDDDAEAPAEG